MECEVPAPRASGRHRGAKRPLNAGTNTTPAASGTEAASGSNSAVDFMIRMLSRRLESGTCCLPRYWSFNAFRNISY
jgi:hypothetical protein